MPAPNIVILYNNSSNHQQNNGYSEGDDNWKILDPINDRIAFLASTVEDGDSTGTKDVFKIPESGSVEVPKQCIKDYNEGIWKRIYLAGSNADSGFGGNYRYAYGVYVDGTSNSAPVLQAWDSVSLTTYTSEVLGGGIPANSMIKAVVTTNAAPGDEWEGTPLAGDGVLNSVLLDTGPIVNSKMLYFNLRLVVPSSASAFAANPVLCTYFTYS